MILGLTGGIGSGKSLASKYFKQLGVVVVDADQVSREVVTLGSPALAAIAEHFGPHMLLQDGSLNRAALRQRIFDDPVEKTWLESLLHPLIEGAMDAQLKAAQAHHSYVILESPLLLETQQHELTEGVVVVDATEQQQLERASQRDNNSASQIKAIMANQMSRQKRLQRADWVLDNQQQPNHLQQQVNSLHQQLCQHAETNT